MLENGVDESYIDGIFKEAEVRFTQLVNGEGLEKSAGGWADILKGVGGLFKGTTKADAAIAHNGWSLHPTNGWLYNGVSGAIPKGSKLVEYTHPVTGEKNVISRRNVNMYNRKYTAAGLTPEEITRLGIGKAPTSPIAGLKPGDTRVAYKDPTTGVISSVQPHEADMLHHLGGHGPSTSAASKAYYGKERTLGRTGIGATIGGVLGMPLGVPGVIGGSALGAGAGALGGRGLLGAGAGVMGYNALKPQARDAQGLPVDRNRVIPGMQNKWTGAIGGALLASILANQMHIGGPMGWLLPLLGGYAGYKGLPGMMNSYKDPLGYGANQVPQNLQVQNAQTFGYQPQASY